MPFNGYLDRQCNSGDTRAERICFGGSAWEPELYGMSYIGECASIRTDRERLHQLSSERLPSDPITEPRYERIFHGLHRLS